MASYNYAACLAETLRHEGGYANHPKDPGGETMYGVIKSVAQRWGYDGPMREIPMDLVHRIYRQDYWDKVKGDQLAAGVDLATFDFGVNSGPSRATRYLMSCIGGTDVQTVKRLCAKRLSFVQALGTWTHFGTGWGRRIASVEAVGVRMALQAAGRKPDEVKKDLEKEADDAAQKRNRDATKSGGAGAGSGAAVPAADGFDWSTLVYVGIGVAVVVGAVFAYRAWVNHKRKKAYEAAAKELQ